MGLLSRGHLGRINRCGAAVDGVRAGTDGAAHSVATLAGWRCEGAELGLMAWGLSGWGPEERGPDGVVGPAAPSGRCWDDHVIGSTGSPQFWERSHSRVRRGL
ncbi:hypothetical protein Sfulv_43320 [Streptomyces fulvorobeus]|uniref:Uncharacterized protein n=1 Tax=Streptomyces fulvorobeus TaxID=284028 RepID=A0A7J0CAK1_9ACTN|nr:hypothetical protein Sfulv_43320 [Streptomyces fulvorobeus]